MNSNPRCARARSRGQRGAAVVEAALVISFFLVPMLVGVLTLGEKLWHAQKHGPYEPRLSSSDISGRLSCDELASRVKTTVVNNAAALDTTVDASWVAVEVVEAVPTLGVLVEVSVTVPAADGSGSSLVTETATRLDNVTLTTESCL